MYKKVTTVKEYYDVKPKHHKHDDDEDIIKLDAPTLVALMSYAKVYLTDDMEFVNFAKAVLDTMREEDDDALDMDDYPAIMAKYKAGVSPSSV